MTAIIDDLPRWDNGQLNRLSSLDLPQPLRTLVGRHTELFHGWVAASNAASAANGAKARAEVEDREARAAALARAEAAPKPMLPVATKTAAEAVQRASDLGRGCVMVEAELPNVVAEYADMLLRQVDDTIAEQQATVREALAALEAALVRIGEAGMLRPQLADPYDPRNWRPSWPPVELAGEARHALGVLQQYG